MPKEPETLRLFHTYLPKPCPLQQPPGNGTEPKAVGKLPNTKALSLYVINPKALNPYSPPWVDRIRGKRGSYCNIPKDIFYLLKGGYQP